MDGDSNDGMSSRTPKKDSRYNPKPKPKKTSRSEKTSRFLFIGLAGRAFPRY